MDPATRRHLETCRDELPASSPSARVLAGLDGFVDRIRHMIRERTSPDAYRRFQHLGEVAERIAGSAEIDSSCTIEWVKQSARTGGFTSNFGGGCQALGLDTFLVGHFGRPVKEVFRREFDPGRLLSLGEPGYTEIVEFRDGKLSLPEIGPLATLDWDGMVESIGLGTLVDWVDGTDLLALGYWSLFPTLPEIMDGMREQVWPRLEDPPSQVLVDPAEVSRLPEEKLRDGLGAFRRMNGVAPVTVTANRTETRTLARLFSPEPEAGLEDWVEVCWRGFGVDRFIGHGKDSAVLRTEGERVRVQSPVTENPAINVGAGDHFAAGVGLGLLEGLSEGSILITGGLVAGCFVREGESPSWQDVTSFLSSYPEYFEKTGEER